MQEKKDIGRVLFRKFPDPNKCHAHESKCCEMMTKVYRFILMASARKLIILKASELYGSINQ